MNSSIGVGMVSHRRYAVKNHQFNYKLYMMYLDLDEIDGLGKQSILLGQRWWQPLRFRQQDYLPALGKQASVKTKALEKLKQLQVVNPELAFDKPFNKVFLLCQLRCFGLFFSPINCYFFATDSDSAPQIMMAEVSNTPWNERHYYLVDIRPEAEKKPTSTDKVFHVSPFMDLNMRYHWQVKVSDKQLLVHIENHRTEARGDSKRLFDATLNLKRQALTKGNIRALFLRFPAMTLTVVVGIYWQALKLFLKKIPFVSHPTSQ